MPTLQTQIGNALFLPSCLYNASGALCTTNAELLALAESAAGAVLTKSCTPEMRTGNPKPRYYETAWGSINSMGLPNKGVRYYADFAKQHWEYLHPKPCIVSVAGLTREDNLAMIDFLAKNGEGVAAIELNLSCPNLPGKPQIGYDFEQTDELLGLVAPLCASKMWGVKLPPYFDIAHFEQMAALLNQYPIAFATCINSIGNGLVIDAKHECVLIKPKNGFGGIGGDYVKPTALANVRQFYTLLRPDISIIGCGGVRSGTDAFEHILCGASVVQIGTTLMREGTVCFERIAQELLQIMQQKGYGDIADFRGKLKTVV